MYTMTVKALEGALRNMEMYHAKDCACNECKNIREALAAERATPMRKAEKFTPGPWLDCGKGSLRTPEGACVDTRVIEAKGWGRIIEILDESNESDANFRLILKAPELYAALQELEGWARARENTMGDPCRLLECQDGIRRAVAKARALREEIAG